MENINDTVYRVVSTGNKWFINLDHDFSAGGENWYGSLEGLHERLAEIFGTNWKPLVEIQKWELSEKRITE